MRSPGCAFLVLCAVLILASTPAPAERSIDTVVGGGPNNVPALLANLANPRAVVADANGNLFIAAQRSARIFKVDASGLLSVVAGNGVIGFSGDGGPATRAGLTGPTSLALDAAGNLFIASPFSYRIRRVDAATGIISTVAGNGLFGRSGDDGPATSARLKSPSGVVVDAAGNLFIADTRSQRIRRVDAATGIISTVAGGGSGDDGDLATSASLMFPRGVVVDAAGNLFIADTNNHRIRHVDAATGIISTVAGNGVAGFSGDGGPATSARVFFPTGVGLDNAGDLLIADTSNHRIRHVDAVTGVISTVAGDGTACFAGDGGPATSASLSDPWSVSVDAAGNLFIADSINNRIRRVDAAAGIISTVVGNGVLDFSGDGGPATSASLRLPADIALDAAGNLFIADYFNNRIRRVDAITGVISTAAGNGVRGFNGDGRPATNTSLDTALGVALDAAGNLFIADTFNSRVRRVDAATDIISTVAGNGTVGFSGDGGPATSASLGTPSELAFDTAGNLFIADYFNNRIRRVDAATGIIFTVAGNGISGFSGDGGPATSASLSRPRGVVLDPAGALFIADLDNQRIRRVDATTGIISTVAGNGTAGFSGDGGLATSASLWNAAAVALDAAGNLFVADLGNNRIRRVDAATGIISTVAGNGIWGFSGDGGPATGASLKSPNGVALDLSGNLYIADLLTHRIRRVLQATQPPVADLTFTPPLLADVSAAFKGIKVGRTIPVKFRLASGAPPAATVKAIISVFRVIDIATGSLDTTNLTADTGSANHNSNVFRFNPITQQYIYNLSTKGFPAPATYRIFVTLDDGSQKSVDFSLRE